MKHTLIALALGGMLAVSANPALYAQDQAPAADAQTQTQQGQGHRHGFMNPDRQLEHLTKTLDLTADQQSQIKPVLIARQQQMQALWQDQTLSRQDRRSKAQAIQQDTRGKIEAVLNDQQKQTFEAQQARMQARRQERMQGGGANQPPASAPQPE